MADGGSAPSVPAGGYDLETDIDVQDISDSMLQKKLSDWTGSDKANRSSSCYYYSLNHRYTEDGFSLTSLQQNEKDRDLSRPLVDLVKTIPIEVFLALLEKDEDAEKNGTPQDGCQSYLVRKLVDLDGHPYASDFPIRNTFNGIIRLVVEPRLSSKHLEAALVFMPRDTVAEFFLSLHKISNKTVLAGDKSYPDLQKILIRYANLCVPHGPRRTRLMPTLKELVAGVLEMDEKMEYECLTDDVFAPVGRALSRARDWALLERIVIQSKGQHGLGLAEWVGVLVKGGHVSLQDVDKWMTACVTSSPYIRKRCEALEKFLTGSACKGGIRSWAVKVLTEKILQDPPKGWFSFEDGIALVAILFRIFEFKDAAMHLSAFAEKHASQITLMIGVVVQLDECFSVATSHAIPLQGASVLFNNLAKQTVDVLDISRLYSSLTLPLRKLLETTASNKMPTCKKQYMEYTLDSLYSTSQSPMLPIKPEKLGQFMSALFRQKVKDSTLMQLAFKTVAKAPLIRRPEVFTCLWLPFLRKLVGILETNKIPLSTLRYRHMFAAILEAYVSSNKGPKPEVGVWIANIENKIGARCACTACKVICQFIRDPNIEYEGGNATVDQVNHIKQHCLDGLNEKILCEHDTRTSKVSIKKIGSYTPKTEGKWARARERAVEQILRFDLSKLEQILGADFSKIWNLEDLALPEAPVSDPPIQPRQALPEAPVRFPPSQPSQVPRQQVPECSPQWPAALPPRPVALPPRPTFSTATTPVTPHQLSQVGSWYAPAPIDPSWTANWNPSGPVYQMPPLPMGNNPNAPRVPSIRDVAMGLPPGPPLPPAIRPLGQPIDYRLRMAMPLPPPPPPRTPIYPQARPVGPSLNNRMERSPPPPRPAARPLGLALNGRLAQGPAAPAQVRLAIPPTHPTVPPARPLIRVPAAPPPSTVPATPKVQIPSQTDSPRAYAMYASEIEGSLHRKFPGASTESMTKALRKRWDALEEKDKAMYNELARKKASEAGGAIGDATSTGVSTPVSKSGSGSVSSSGSKKSGLIIPKLEDYHTPVQRSTSGTEKSSASSGSKSSRASGCLAPPRTLLQAASGNAQHPLGSAPTAAGLGGGKRKFSGGHKNARAAPSLCQATLAGQLYYPHVEPTSTPTSSAAKGGGGSRAEAVDLTLDDD